jgi:hypothetical protein
MLEKLHELTYPAYVLIERQMAALEIRGPPDFRRGKRRGRGEISLDPTDPVY